MSNAGSLIQLHFHNNIEVLNNLSDTDGILYYQGSPVFPSVSKKKNNGIVLEADGLYMSNLTMLSATQYNIVSRFSYDNGALLFDNIIVSQEYTELQIRVMLDTMWKEIEPDFDIKKYIDSGTDESGGDTGDATES